MALLTSRQMLLLISFLFFFIGLQDYNVNAARLTFRPFVPQATLARHGISVQSPPEAGTLELGKTIERELSGGQKHDYRFTLAEGQYAGITVEQRGIDVVVRMLGTNGEQLTEFDDEIRLHGQEQVEVVAVTAGVYRLRVEAKGQEGPPGSYLIRFNELRPAAERDRSLQEARLLYTQSVALRRSAKYDEALLSGTRALSMRQELLGPEHADVATALNNLGVIHNLKGEQDKSEAFNQQALAIRMKVLGPDHPHVAYSLNNLAVIQSRRGKYREARLLYQRALEIKEKSQGPEHPDVATSVHNLASAYFDMGDFLKAEQLQQRALQIREKVFGPHHPVVAGSLNNLGNVHDKLGDYYTAAALHRRALDIREKALGPAHNDVATSLNNLANAYFGMGEYVKAEPLYERAVEIRERALGKDNDLVATPLNNLAQIYYHRGDYTRSELNSRRALEISVKALGPDHPRVASPLNNLARILYLKGEYAEAERLYQRGVILREKAQGPNHPRLGELLNDLGQLYAGKGDVDRAITTQERANSLTERNLAINLATGSERQKLAYLVSLSEITDRTLSLHARSAPNNSQARELAVTAILQRKGRVLDVLSDSLTMLRSRFNAQDQTLLDQLNDTTAHLANLVLREQRMTDADHQEIKALQEQREKLEREISHRSAGSYQQSQPMTLAAIHSAIPTDAALIEFAVYHPFDPKADEAKAYGKPHYIAYVLRRQGEVQWKELGEVEPIDLAIKNLRKALHDPQRKDVQELARAVNQRVMQPLRTLLDGATHLLISPDGELNLIPFGALVDEQGHYLIERYSFTYLTSGRDLLRMQVARAPKADPLVIADPLFGEAGQDLVASTSPAPGVIRRRGVTNARDLSDVYFAPLSGTAVEANSIKKLFPEASLLAGPKATESALKGIAAPRILHIATHGFFLDEKAIAGGNNTPTASRASVTTPPIPGNLTTESTTPRTTRGMSAGAKVDNPLLRSGLALAGANLRNAKSDDGILTALEASGLNLWGTKLVVLSACDTGVGEVRNGEGVYGLRRAFVLAGAESLVMSLWPASDYTTRKLMIDYYKNLKQGLGRGAALREVQLAMLKRNPQLHPFYWANFIQSGEWANLEGKR